MLEIADVTIKILILVFGIMFMLSIATILIVSLSLSKKTEKKYKKNVIQILLNNKENILDSIRNAYSTYKNKRYGFGYLGIIEINQIIIEDLRTGEYIKYSRILSESSALADRLDNIVIELEKLVKFDDARINHLFEDISKSLNVQNKNLVTQLRDYINHINSFNSGRIFEKEYYISSLETKLKRKRWISVALGTLSLISSIITILTIF